MTLTNIAINSLRRRKVKAILILVALMLGVATVISLTSFIDAARHDLHDKVDLYGANIIIVPKTENLSLSYGGMTLGGVSFEMQEIQEKELSKIRTIKNSGNIAVVGPSVLGPVSVTDHRILLAGVDFEAYQVLRAWWKVKGGIPQGDGAVLGADIARIFNMNVGSSLNMQGRTIPVTGIIERTGSQDDGLIFLPLRLAQHILNKKGKVSMVEVAALCANCPVDEIVKQISEVLPQTNVMPILQVVKGRMETIGYFKKFSYAISALILLVGGMMVLVTMTASVRERTPEIGIFRAVGFRRSHIMGIIFTEAGILAGIAGIGGYFVGLFAAKVFLPHFIGFKDVSVHFDPAMATGALMLAIILGLISSLYPALLAAKLDPNEALRSL